MTDGLKPRDEPRDDFERSLSVTVDFVRLKAYWWESPAAARASVL